MGLIALMGKIRKGIEAMNPAGGQNVENLREKFQAALAELAARLEKLLPHVDNALPGDETGRELLRVITRLKVLGADPANPFPPEIPVPPRGETKPIEPEKPARPGAHPDHGLPEKPPPPPTQLPADKPGLHPPTQLPADKPERPDTKPDTKPGEHGKKNG